MRFNSLPRYIYFIENGAELSVIFSKARSPTPVGLASAFAPRWCFVKRKAEGGGGGNKNGNENVERERKREKESRRNNPPGGCDCRGWPFFFCLCFCSGLLTLCFILNKNNLNAPASASASRRFFPSRFVPSTPLTVSSHTVVVDPTTPNVGTSKRRGRKSNPRNTDLCLLRLEK